jgi:DNA repair protein RadC
MTNEALGNREMEDQTIAAAVAIIERRLRVGGTFPLHEALKSLLSLRSQGLAGETFAVMYLDAKLRLIDYESANPRPREVVNQALFKDAAFVVLHHHHSSGTCWPSFSNYQQAVELRRALDVFGVPVLDHVITSDEGLFSVVERGFC